MSRNRFIYKLCKFLRNFFGVGGVARASDHPPTLVSRIVESFRIGWIVPGRYPYVKYSFFNGWSLWEYYLMVAGLFVLCFLFDRIVDHIEENSSDEELGNHGKWSWWF